MTEPSNIPEDLRRFLVAIDSAVDEAGPVQIVIGGAAAILIAYDPGTATEDVDFIGRKTGLLGKLARLAGRGSKIHEQTQYYLDIVPPGLFPQEWGWQNRARTVSVRGVVNLELRVLELHDLVLSKLKRFSAKDRDDVRLLCARSELDIEVLRERYRHARRLYDHDEREELDANFGFIEREFLGIRPTTFE